MKIEKYEFKKFTKNDRIGSFQNVSSSRKIYLGLKSVDLLKEIHLAPSR